jgi:hypothetical protein
MEDSGLLAGMPTGMEVVFFVVAGAIVTGRRQSGSDGSFHHGTFETLDGSRFELHCTGCQYAMLADGDRGALTYQHDVLRSFVRGNAVGRD